MAGNGNSGRPPKPAIVHLLSGNPSKRNVKELLDEVQQPVLPVEAPTRPDWLSEEALKEWDELIPDLITLGLVSRLDGQAIAQYCEAAVEYRKFTRMIQELNNNLAKANTGDVQTYKSGATDMSIWRKLRNDAQRRADEAGRQFGFTPLARRALRLTSPQRELIPNEPRDAAAKYFS
ncbi:phage terminase small subunit P27 family [Pseudomonas viridiflava]|uniref:phage terminase small subunit P27 family n=1 Tax=Pseudomonas viridiflava TaxID=33069 RepID=UPI000F01D222|nr:phage terminase small subunit P27 family [Pseudomonas viridiflava]MBD8187804.1 phage terminase small subunit P27 family [Pseudomonas viridiflava]MBV1813487.1 phage terminase small subunit P27 family [Pseudomonas viridiflava]